MAEFGQPSRTATSDANAGVVNAPAQREVARTSVSQNVRTAGALDAPLKNVGSALGGSFVRMLKKNTENVRAQQVLDASLRQGSDNAINAIDSEKKRTGWEKALYGEENPEYRSAQQRAVGNNIQQAYLEQANKISEFAGESQEEYQGRLRAGLDVQLKKYPNDPETQQLITEHWSKASEKLVTQQAKDHYGHNLAQQRETVKNGVRGTFDVFTTESKNINTEKEALAFAQNAGDFFNMSAKPADMDAGAYRGVVNEELIYSLQSGNIGAYNMAKDHGWLDNLNTKEQAKFQTARNAYDVKANHGIALTSAEANLAAADAVTLEDIQTIVAQGEATLTSHEERSSGSDKSKVALAKARLALKKAYNKAIVEASEKQVKIDRANDILEAETTNDAGMKFELNATNAEQAAAASTMFVNTIENVTGQEDLKASDAIKEILADPVNVGSKAVQQWGESNLDAGYLKIIGQQYTTGYASSAMLDENDQPTEVATKTMDLLSQFEQKDLQKFQKQMGEHYDDYLLVKEGQQGGLTSGMIKEKIDAFHESIGNKDMYAVNWPESLTQGKTKRDYVSQLVEDYTKSYPTGTDVGRHVETYLKALTHAKGDHRQAKDALRNSVKNKSEVYNGRVIHNADKINDQLEKYTLPLLLTQMERPENNASIGIIAAGLGGSEDANGNPIRTFKELGQVDYEVSVDGGLWVKSPKFISPVHVSSNTVKLLEEYIIQNQNEIAMEKQIKKLALLKKGLGDYSTIH